MPRHLQDYDEEWEEGDGYYDAEEYDEEYYAPDGGLAWLGLEPEYEDEDEVDYEDEEEDKKYN